MIYKFYKETQHSWQDRRSTNDQLTHHHIVVTYKKSIVHLCKRLYTCIFSTMRSNSRREVQVEILSIFSLRTQNIYQTLDSAYRKRPVVLLPLQFEIIIREKQVCSHFIQTYVYTSNPNILLNRNFKATGSSSSN